MRRIIGLIADTHGRVREGCATALHGVDLILHAGDVGGAHVLLELGLIAPVRAVHGNTDVLDGTLPASLDFTLDGLSIHVSHGHELGSPTSAGLVARYPADVLVYGHTHRALVERVGRQLVVNPGAAGPARFKHRPSVARLTIEAGNAAVEIVDLD